MQDVAAMAAEEGAPFLCRLTSSSTSRDSNDMAIRKRNIKPTKTQQILEFPLVLIGGLIEGCQFVGKRLSRSRAQAQSGVKEENLSDKSAVRLQEKLSDTIQVSNDVFSVATTTRFMLYSKPHSVVIPFRLNGKLTLERGFLVEYTTDDADVLKNGTISFARRCVAGLPRSCLSMRAPAFSRLRKMRRIWHHTSRVSAAHKNPPSLEAEVLSEGRWVGLGVRDE